MQISRAPSRRIILRLFGIGIGAGLAAPLASGAARAATSPAEAEIAKLLAGRTPKTGGIRLDAPAIAENGLVVPINIECDSPMTDADHVRTVRLFADGNPVPLVTTFHFTPACGRAAASIRIRLAQTQNVIAVAETSTGELRMARTEVKVTIGGCGG